MKNMLVAFYATIIALIIILIGFTIHGRSVRQVELDNALKSSMEDAMTNLMYEEGRPQTEEEWKEDFLQSIAIQINSASDLEVTILEADMDKGLLSAEAELTWKHPIGTDGSVSSSMTVLLDECEEDGYYEKTEEIDLQKFVSHEEVAPILDEEEISTYERKVIDAGYGVVVEIAQDVYAVLVHMDTYINGIKGGAYLREYLNKLNLEPGSLSGAIIDSERDWYWYIAEDVYELVTPDEEEFWD